MAATRRFRGSTPEAPTIVDGDRHVFRLEVLAGEIVELKLVRGDDAWAAGRNYAVHTGDHLRIEPYFSGSAPALEQLETLQVEGEPISFEVLLPPGHAEQERKRYPVLYVLDGQSLWSTSSDPYGA